MNIFQNLHNIKTVEIKLSSERYPELPEEDQPTAEWFDFQFSDDSGDMFELTVFGSPAIKFGEVDDILSEIATLRDELAGLAEANHDLVEARRVAKNGRRAAERVCDDLRSELAGEQDAHKFTQSQLADVNSELRADVAESDGRDHDCPRCGGPVMMAEAWCCTRECARVQAQLDGIGGEE